ncbi:nucleotidyltransferase domain-containing protein [Amycolatopsis sp. lyj-23]|uniref:nucleotidyltransferase domain-containing protein n=1 Tax=Amycolatopsis sp. lyj-23 TaxID=2789283 RepID=UPI0039792EE9
METAEVLEVVRACRAAGIEVWIDGGWCVDALLGRRTREHDDLDVAVSRPEVSRLRECLAALGYAAESRAGATEWNFVLARSGGGSVDVHVFEFDADGNHIHGIEYPNDSFSGVGVLGGEQVRCISPERMFQFKTAYPPAAKDLLDVRAMSARFGFALPASHRTGI